MTVPTPDPFVHPALLYRGQEEYLAGTVPFVRDGLAAGAAVAVAVPGRNLAAIRGALGADADRVHLVDMAEAGRNPGRIIPSVLLAFALAHIGRAVRIIGEPIWPDRTPDEYPACVQHEALINLAFEGRDATILCPYDAGRLGSRVIGDAAATHPALIDRSGRRDSGHYAPRRVLDAYNLPLEAPGNGSGYTFTLDTLEHARAYAVADALRFGLPLSRADDVRLAVTELAANSIRHGGGRGTVEVWADDGHVLCQVRDEGTITDPLAGRRPAPAGGAAGRGLLLVNLLADLVRTHTTAGATTTRLYFRTTAAAR